MIIDIVEIPMRVPPDGTLNFEFRVFPQGDDTPMYASRELFMMFMDVYRYKLIESRGSKFIERVIVSLDPLDLNTLKLNDGKCSVELHCITTKIYSVDRHGNHTISGYNHTNAITRLLERCTSVNRRSMYSVHQYILDLAFDTLMYNGNDMEIELMQYADSQTYRLRNLLSSKETVVSELLINASHVTRVLASLGSSFDKYETIEMIDQVLQLPEFDIADSLSHMFSSDRMLMSDELIPHLSHQYTCGRIRSKVYSGNIFPLDNTVQYMVDPNDRHHVLELISTLSHLPFTDISLQCINGTVKTHYTVSMYGRISNSINTDIFTYIVDNIARGVSKSSRVLGWTLVKTYSEEVYLNVETSGRPVRLYFDMTVSTLCSVGIVDRYKP